MDVRKLQQMSEESIILVTGGTGYVGGRLIPLLERRGHAVRCLARRPEFLQSRVGSQTEVVTGYVLQLESLNAALGGGQTGWYCGNWLWGLRGWLDIDCWRVEAFEPNRRLRLFAEMRLPGRAWLEFELEPTAKGSRLRQTAVFDPVGPTGLAYWNSIYPLHEFIFGGMLKRIANAARSSIATATTWQPTVLRQAVWLIGLLVLCLGSAGLGGLATSTSVDSWYQTLAKPSWTPPGWLFGPVWTVLYLMMAVSAWLVWRQAGWPSTRAPLSWFGVQLALNVGWSVVFFGLQLPAMACVEIVLLWLSIAVTILAFRRRSVPASWLLVPYLAWTTFAALLNAAIWRLNS